MCQAVSSTLILITSFLFIPISLALIVIGALVRWNRQMLVVCIVPSLLGKIDNSYIHKAASIVIVAIFSFFESYGLVVFIFSLILFVVAFCGVFGVCCKSRILLGTYAALLLLILFALLITTIVFGKQNYEGFFQLFRNLIDTYRRYMLYAMIGMLLFTLLLAVNAIYLLIRYLHAMEYISKKLSERSFTV